MGVLINLLEQTGLCPGKWARYLKQGGADESASDQRLVPFHWKDIHLFFERLVPALDKSNGAAMELSFYLSIKFIEGTN